MNEDTCMETPNIFSRLNSLDSMIRQIEDKLFASTPNKESSLESNSIPLLSVIQNKLDNATDRLEKISKELYKI